MSERKVLTKYYPPDFDPSQLTRRRKKHESGPPKLQTVRLMAPFSMRCNSCGEFIYKGRKFNARKETTDEKYYNISIYRFYIRCTGCSAEICFKTDPRHLDYECESGAKRNFEPWREAKLAEETEEERLDRLEQEEANRDVMADLETKALDAKTEMAVADALDEIRVRNARLNRAQDTVDQDALREAEVRQQQTAQDLEDEEAARRAFSKAKASSAGEGVVDGVAAEETTQAEAPAPAAPAPTFQRTKKKKKDAGFTSLGIKKKAPLV